MQEKRGRENESSQELDPIGSLLSELCDPQAEEEEFRSNFFLGLEGRRRKAAFVLMTICGTTITLQVVSWGYFAVLALSGLLTIQAIRIVSTKVPAAPKPLSDDRLANAPMVSLLVAAKNEEAVIGKLIENLCNLNYPVDKYEVWAIDDNSSDRTPEILNRLKEKYTCLKVLRRGAGASGGKSGALNQVLPLTEGQIIAVFDADAVVTPDLLRRTIPMFTDEKMGAVQVRKAISNAPLNFWTRGQMAEMALDTYLQQQRIAMGGIGELRGNGQFVNRYALQRCGGWNEQTITDDLDLTIRLHLDGWDIGFLSYPPVREEGVTTVKSLWHQRNRWAEGGYQRYLDYWRLIISNPMSFQKTFDLLSFMLIQYLLPVAAIPDLMMAVARHRLPILSPLSTILFTLVGWGMLVGLRRTHDSEKLTNWERFTIALQTVHGFIYMFHWFVVMVGTTIRMSVRPKRLKWIKTVHEGNNQESFEF